VTFIRVVLWGTSLFASVFEGAVAGVCTLTYALLVLVVNRWAFGCSKLRSTRNAISLCAAALPLVALVVAWQSIAIGGMATPYLAGSDGEGYYVQAVDVMSDIEAGRPIGLLANYTGFQHLLAGVFLVTGPDLYTALLFNALVFVTAVAVLGRATYLLGVDPEGVFWTVVLFLLTTRFTFYAMALLKEPFLVLGVALLVYAVAAVGHSWRDRWLSTAGVVFAVAIFGTMRLPLLILLPVTAASLGWRGVTQGARPLVVGAVVLALFGGVFAQMTSRELSLEAFQRTFLDNQLLENYLAVDTQAAAGVVGGVMGAYTQRSMTERVMLLPVAAAIQHVMPPDVWSTRFVTDHAVVFFGVNANIVWLLFVGMTVIYAGVFWRGIDIAVVRRLCLCGWLFTLATAFTFGGVVPRYASPYLLLIYPAAGWVMAHRHDPRARNRAVVLGVVVTLVGGFAATAYLLFRLMRGA